MKHFDIFCHSTLNYALDLLLELSFLASLGEKRIKCTLVHCGFVQAVRPIGGVEV